MQLKHRHLSGGREKAGHLDGTADPNVGT